MHGLKVKVDQTSDWDHLEERIFRVGGVNPESRKVFCRNCWFVSCTISIWEISAVFIRRWESYVFWLSMMHGRSTSVAWNDSEPNSTIACLSSSKRNQ